MEFDEALSRVLDSGKFIRGEEVLAFEQEFSAFCGTEFCVGVGNGLDALTLILRGYMESGRLKPGDEVVLPANTFIATALAVTMAGLNPILADPDPLTHNINAASVESVLTPRTRAVIAVHLYGRLADMSKLRVLTEKNDLLLIEDAAQAHGATFRGVCAGSFGDAAAFSFFPGKNLGALGDAGAVVTNDRDLAQSVASLSNYGSLQKYHHDKKGMNSRLDELQAAFLRIKLRALKSDNEERNTLARYYLNMIQHAAIRLPQAPHTGECHAWHLFVVECEFRDALQAHLATEGVATLIHYPVPIHKQHAYASQFAGSYPIAEGLANRVLSLPIYPGLNGAERVVAACNNFPV